MNQQLFEMVRDEVKEVCVVEEIDSLMIDLYRQQYDMSRVFEQIRQHTPLEYKSFDGFNYHMKWMIGNVYYRWERNPFIMNRIKLDKCTLSMGDIWVIVYDNTWTCRKKIFGKHYKEILYGDTISKNAILKRKIKEKRINDNKKKVVKKNKNKYTLDDPIKTLCLVVLTGIAIGRYSKYLF